MKYMLSLKIPIFNLLITMCEYYIYHRIGLKTQFHEKNFYCATISIDVMLYCMLYFQSRLKHCNFAFLTIVLYILLGSSDFFSKLIIEIFGLLLSIQNIMKMNETNIYRYIYTYNVLSLIGQCFKNQIVVLSIYFISTKK